MSVCDQLTDSNYIQEFLNIWGSNGTKDQIGYECVDGTNKNKINLLDFLNVVVQSKKGTKVGGWCNSCTTISQTDKGYLTISGALDLNGSSSSTKPLYFNKTDVETRGSLVGGAYDIISGKWNNPQWPTIITKTPKDKIRILDQNGISIQNSNISIETVPVGDVSNINDNNPNESNFSKYYYLFVKVKDCNNIPLPVYQHTSDSNVSGLLNDDVWPLVGNNGEPLNVKFNGCPVGCNSWEWNK